MTWLALSVAVAVLGTAIGLAIPLRRVRRRRAAAEVVLLADAFARPAPERPFPPREAVLQLAVEDEATRGVEWDLHRLFPVPAPDRDDDEDSRPVLDRFFADLARHPIQVAVAEGVLVNLLTAPYPDPQLASVALQQLGSVVPEHLHAAGEAVLRYLHSAEFSDTLVETAHGMFKEIMTDLAREGALAEIGRDLAQRHFAEAFGHVGEAVAGSLPEGVKTLVSGAMDSVDMADAMDHLATIGSTTVDAAGGLDAHFPVLTAAISSWREVRLLTEDKTTWDRSAANIAWDVAGTGVGGTLGGFIGGLIGTAIAPGVGTVIGKVIGAGLGAAAGRSVTDHGKQARLREAVEVYQSRLDEYPDRVRELTGEMVDAVRDKAGTHHTAYQAGLAAAPAIEAAGARACAQDLHRAVTRRIGAVRRLAGRAEPLAGSDPALARALDQLTDHLSDVDGALTESADRLASGDHVRAMVVLAVAAVPVVGGDGSSYQTACRAVADRVDTISGTRRDAVIQWAVDSARTYQTHATALAEDISEDAETYRREIAAAAAVVSSAADRLRQEQKALGIS